MLLALLGGLSLAAAAAGSGSGSSAGSVVAPQLVDMNLFVGGQGGYACYRLPNLVQLREPGHMLAIVQGHKYDCSDGGRMDILSRRSTTGGRSWEAPRFVYGESTPTKNVTMGTPAAVVDMHSPNSAGAVYLFICRNFKQVLLLASQDSGQTWGKPRDLTQALVPTDWTGVWTGLPQGIQLDSGRLIVCANHGVSGSSVRPGGTHSHTIYSDTHGLTWRNGASVSAANATAQHMGECSLAQTSAGVFLYARVWWDDGEPGNGRSTRALAFSTGEHHRL